jgi:hypothetical protein
VVGEFDLSQLVEQSGHTGASAWVGLYRWRSFTVNATSAVMLEVGQSYFVVLEARGVGSVAGWAIGSAAGNLSRTASDGVVAGLARLGSILVSTPAGALIDATAAGAGLGLGLPSTGSSWVAKTRLYECPMPTAWPWQQARSPVFEAVGPTTALAADAWNTNAANGPAAQAFRVTEQVNVTSIEFELMWTAGVRVRLNVGFNFMRLCAHDPAVDRPGNTIASFDLTSVSNRMGTSGLGVGIGAYRWATLEVSALETPLALSTDTTYWLVLNTQSTQSAAWMMAPALTPEGSLVRAGQFLAMSRRGTYINATQASSGVDYVARARFFRYATSVPGALPSPSTSAGSSPLAAASPTPSSSATPAVGASHTPSKAPSSSPARGTSKPTPGTSARGDSEHGLAIGAAVALAVAVPLVIAAIAALAVFMWRTRVVQLLPEQHDDNEKNINNNKVKDNDHDHHDEEDMEMEQFDSDIYTPHTVEETVVVATK